MKKFILPLLIVCIFVSESIFVELTPHKWMNTYIIVPHFLAILLSFVALYVSKWRGLIYAVVFGAIYDISYVEILGVNLFAFFIVTYLTAQVAKVLQGTIAVGILLSILNVAFIEFYIYGVYLVIGKAHMDFQAFLYERLLPTLIFHLVVVIIFTYPLRRILRALRIEKKESPQLGG